MASARAGFDERIAAAIARHSVDAVLAIDEAQKVIFFNDGAEELFGYTREEMLGSSLNRLIPERYREVHPQHVRDFAASPVVVHRLGHQRPVPGLRRDGTEFIAEIAFSKLVIDGELVMVATLHDVTARIEQDSFRDFLVESSRVLTAGMRFGERADRLAHLIVPRYADWSLIDLMTDDTLTRAGVAHRDPEREAELRELREFTFDHEQRVGPVAVVRRGEPELVRAVTADWLRELAVDEDHFEQLRRLDPESVLILPLITSGRTLGAVTAVYSGSGRLYTSDDIRIGLEFAGLAALHIDNARYYREAVEAIGIRDKVLRIVAHDLRNPLNTISLSAGILHDLGEHDPGSPGAHAVEVIERAVSRADRLIQDLLDVGRIGRGALGLSVAPIPARLLLEETLDQHRPLAAERSITLVSDYPTDLPKVLADRDRIFQAFENLIGNAIKFTPEGGTITIGAERRGGEVVFRVEDTGLGISEEVRARLFDPYWQAVRSGRGGAGLGLAITRGIVQAHRGRIWVDSELGRGSTFYFTVPVAEDVVPRDMGQGEGGAGEPHRPG